MSFDGLGSLPLENPACRPRHGLQHATGLDYVVEPVVGLGLVATNGAKINTTALAEKAPCWCAPQAKVAAPACDVKQY